MRSRNDTNGPHIVAYKSCYLVGDGFSFTSFLRGCKLGESADLLSLESKTAALTKILPYTTSQMFWCRDCPLGTALLASVLHFRGKQHDITSWIDRSRVNRAWSFRAPSVGSQAELLHTVCWAYLLPTLWIRVGHYIRIRTFPPTFERIFEFRIKSDSTTTPIYPFTHWSLTRSNLGFSILLKDTLICSWGSWGFEPTSFQVQDDLLDLLSNRRPRNIPTFHFIWRKHRWMEVFLPVVSLYLPVGIWFKSTISAVVWIMFHVVQSGPDFTRQNGSEQ